MDIKDFKIIVLQLLRELQGNRNEQFNDIKKTIQERNEKFNKEKTNKQTKKKNPVILELKNIVTELKNTIESFNISLELGEERISEQID